MRRMNSLKKESVEVGDVSDVQHSTSLENEVINQV